jgi:hypothetical protein
MRLNRLRVEVEVLEDMKDAEPAMCKAWLLEMFWPDGFVEEWESPSKNTLVFRRRK